MERALIKGLKCKPEFAKKFLKTAGSDERAAEIIFGWTDETKPPYASRLNRDWIEFGLRASKLTAWAEEFGKGTKEFLENATLFELQITMEANPTYPFIANFRGVTLPACIELARRLGLALTVDQICYAVAMEGVWRKKLITQEEYEQALKRYGATYYDPMLCDPFPRVLLVDHPLFGRDPDTVGILDLRLSGASFSGPSGGAIEKIREYKNMQNRLRRACVNGVVHYKLREGISRVVQGVRELNRVVL